MSKWVLVQHVPFEEPGAIADAAQDAGIVLEIVRPWEGNAIPDLDGLDGVIVLGGPMGALDDDAYPNLTEEKRLMARAVERGIPVLGVCLGAQLLAAALGGEISTGAVDEVGVGTVSVVGGDPVLNAGASAGVLPVVHWHEDTFTIPAAAELIASSDAFAHQAFRIGNSYALQFHVEATPEWADAASPHLPEGVTLDPAELEAVAVSGRKVLDAFFAQAR